MNPSSENEPTYLIISREEFFRYLIKNKISFINERGNFHYVVSPQSKWPLFLPAKTIVRVAPNASTKTTVKKLQDILPSEIVVGVTKNHLMDVFRKIPKGDYIIPSPERFAPVFTFMCVMYQVANTGDNRWLGYDDVGGFYVPKFYGKESSVMSATLQRKFAMQGLSSLY